MSQLTNLHPYQNRQSKQFKPNVCQRRGKPLTNSGRGNQYYNNKNRNRFYHKGSHMIQIEVIIGTIRISEAGTTVEMIGKGVMYNWGDRKKNIKDRNRSYDGGRCKEKGNIGKFSRNRWDSWFGNRGRSSLGIKVKRKDVITVDNQDIL